MNTIFIATECFPFAKTSNMGDLVSILAKEIEKQGHNIKVFIPRYGCIDPGSFLIERIPYEFKVRLDHSLTPTSVFKGIIPNSLVSVYFIESQTHFSNSKEIYLPSNNEKEILERTRFFCLAILEVISKLKIKPDIIHFFNPQTSYISELLNSKNIEYSHLKKTKTVFTIENLSGLNPNLIKTTKQAIVHSDFVTAVSKTYAYELLSDIQNIGLSDLLTKKKDSFCGILTGIDEEIYNPETDNTIAQIYSKNYFSIGKKRCKEDLLELLNLEKNLQIPLFGLISRLTIDSGVDLLIDSIPHIADLNLQLIIQGKGDAIYEQKLIKTARNYKNIKIINDDDHNLSKKIYSACDFLICPSMYEPSGNSLLVGMKYGCVPVAYAIGAVKDIVIDLSLIEEANGITFKEYKKEDFLNAISIAMKCYKNKEKWPRIVKQAMNFDSSKLNSARKYINCYEKILNTSEVSNANPVHENVYQ